MGGLTDEMVERMAGGVDPQHVSTAALGCARLNHADPQFLSVRSRQGPQNL
jgi:hypothetical protein